MRSTLVLLAFLCACASAPDPSAATLYRAREASRHGDWEMARVHWKQLYVAGEPSQAVVAGYARSLAELGQSQAASDILARALVDPAPAAALAMQRARLLERLDQAQDAEAAWARAVRDDPASAAARRGHGRVLLWLGRVEEALAEAREAVRLDPDDAAGLELLVDAGGLLESTQDVYRGLSGLADQGSLPAASVLELVRAGRAAGEDAGVLEAYVADALADDPQLVDVWRAWGELLLERGEDGLAAEKLARAVELEPTDVASLLALGRAYGRLADAPRLEAVIAHARSFVEDEALRAEFEALRAPEQED